MRSWRVKERNMSKYLELVMKKRSQFNKDELEKFTKWLLKEFTRWDINTIKETYDEDEIVELYARHLLSDSHAA